MALIRLSKAGERGKRHSHILYVAPDGNGVTSVNRKHSHGFITPEQTEEEAALGIDVIAQLIPGPDGHTHELISSLESGRKQAKPEKDELKQAARCRALYLAAETYEKDFREKGKEAEEFYRGDQWSRKIKDKMGDRPAITINEIQAKIDILSGYQRRNRTDIRYYPMEGGDAAVADILTELVKNINIQNGYPYEETLVFEDEAIVGRGLINPEISYEDNIEGDVRVTKEEWDEVWFGEHNSMTADDAEYMVRGKYMSWAKLKAKYPDKEKKLDADIQRFKELRNTDTHDSKPGGSYDDGVVSELETGVSLDQRFIDTLRKTSLVLEVWEKKYRPVAVITNPLDDFYESSGEWSSKDIKDIETIPDLRVIQTFTTDMAVTMVAGNVILDQFIDEDYDGMFPVIPVYAYKRKKYVWGKIETAKDPQREVNKRVSQYTELISKVAAYGWFYDKDTFENVKEEAKFKKNSSTPGFTQKINDTNRPPIKVEGVKFPAEIVNLSTIMSGKLRENMNVNPELQGLSSRAESGVALAQKKAQGLIGNEFLFDNLARSKARLGRLYITFIQKIYSAERIMTILENRNRQEPFQIGGQDFERFPPQDIIRVLRDADLTRYHVVVGESDLSPTIRSANFAMWSDLAGKGYPVPPQLLIDLSDLPDKKKWREAMQEEQARLAQMEGQQGKNLPPEQQQGGVTG